MEQKKQSVFKFRVHVVPSSRVVSVYLRKDETISVHLNNPPEKGKANAELINILAKWLNISKTEIKIIRGETNRVKLLELPTEYKNIFIQKKSELSKTKK